MPPVGETSWSRCNIPVGETSGLNAFPSSDSGPGGPSYGRKWHRIRDREVPHTGENGIRITN